MTPELKSILEQQRILLEERAKIEALLRLVREKLRALDLAIGKEEAKQIGVSGGTLRAEGLAAGELGSV